MPTKGPTSYTDGLIEKMIKAEVQSQTGSIRSQLAAANRRLKNLDFEKAKIEKSKIELEKLTKETKKIYTDARSRAIKEVKSKVRAELNDMENMDRKLRQAFARLNKFVDEVEKIRTKPISELIGDPIHMQFNAGSFTYTSVNQTIRALRNKLGNLEKETSDEELINKAKGE